MVSAKMKVDSGFPWSMPSSRMQISDLPDNRSLNVTVGSLSNKKARKADRRGLANSAVASLMSFLLILLKALLTSITATIAPLTEAISAILANISAPALRPTPRSNEVRKFLSMASCTTCSKTKVAGILSSVSSTPMFRIEIGAPGFSKFLLKKNPNTW